MRHTCHLTLPGISVIPASCLTTRVLHWQLTSALVQGTRQVFRCEETPWRGRCLLFIAVLSAPQLCTYPLHAECHLSSHRLLLTTTAVSWPMYLIFRCEHHKHSLTRSSIR